MIVDTNFDAHYTGKSMGTGYGFLNHEIIIREYNDIIKSDSSNMNKSIAYYVQIAFGNCPDSLYSKKEANQLINFLQSKNFNFEPVRKVILQDAYSYQESISYWNQRINNETSSSLRKDHKLKAKVQQEEYYSCVVAASNISSLSNDTTKIIALTDEIANLKESIAKINSKASNLLLATKKTALEKILKIKTTKLTNIVQKMGLSQSQLQQIITSKCETAVLEEAISLGENGQNITEAQEQAIIEKTQAKYSSLLDLNLSNSMETAL